MQFAWQYGKEQMNDSYNAIKTVLESNLKLMKMIESQGEMEKEIVSGIVIRELNKMTNKLINKSDYDLN